MSKNKVLSKINVCIFKNSDKAKIVQIRHEKLSSHPNIIILDSNGIEIEAQVRYLDSVIEISTNESVYYEVYIY